MKQFKTIIRGVCHLQKTSLLVLSVLLSTISFSQTWVQKGLDIDGEAAHDLSGWSVSMPDANTVAIGAPRNDGNGEDAGHVRIYEWNGSAWVQKGGDIDGEAAYDESGYSVSMPDANTVAIGAPFNAGSSAYTGHVRIYEWDGNAWVQKGGDIDGEAAGYSIGWSVSMPDANTVAIGAPIDDGNSGIGAGHVRIYVWSGSFWIQKGQNIVGEATSDWSGYSVSMPDANTVAIGAPMNGGNGFRAGHVRIYEWDSNSVAWVQKGGDIDGEAAYDQSGHSVSMPDANTVAIGAPMNAGNGTEAGHVRVYEWNGSAWQQKGIDIDGEAAYDYSGTSVSMPDANTVAIGAYGNDFESGHVRIYEWNGSVWQQKGQDIDGEVAEDFSGWSVSMPDAHTVTIGAPENDGNGIDAGHVRVYSFGTVGVTENQFGSKLQVYPNPTNGELTINLGETYPLTEVRVFNTLGQEVLYKKVSNTQQFTINIVGARGIYTIKINSGDKIAILKILKQD